MVFKNSQLSALPRWLSEFIIAVIKGKLRGSHWDVSGKAPPQTLVRHTPDEEIE
jgi:hypothetical protein